MLTDAPSKRPPHATDPFAPDRPNKQQGEGAQVLTRSLKVCDHPESENPSIGRGSTDCDNAVDEYLKISRAALTIDLRR